MFFIGLGIVTGLATFGAVRILSLSAATHDSAAPPISRDSSGWASMHINRSGSFVSNESEDDMHAGAREELRIRLKLAVF
jgi:hypothetical protein